MVLEVIGLGVLLPIISILLDPDLIEQTPFIGTLRTQFSELSHKSFVIIILLGFLLFYFFKSLFLVLLTHKQNVLLNNITSSLSVNLFKSYLNQTYSFHLNRNTSELIKNIQIEFNHFYSFLFALVSTFIEGGFILAILATLIYVEPIGALSIGLFYGVLSLMFMHFTKKKIKVWSALRENVDTKLSKTALEGLGGVKDLIILGKAYFFINQFAKDANLKARLNANQNTMSLIPRFYLEFISIFGLVSFIIIMFFQGKDSTNLIAVLGIFVAATFKIIPSLNKIIASFQSLKYLKPSLNIIYNEIKNYLSINKENLIEKEFFFKKNIKFENVSFTFNGTNFILKKANLEINKGHKIGIIGESGSGKSTLVDIILGLHKPTEGKIIIDGKDDVQFEHSWKNNIGYVSQSIYLIDDTIKNNIAFGIPEKAVNQNRINEVLNQVQLMNFINNLELGVETKVGDRGVQLSGESETKNRYC